MRIYQLPIRLARAWVRGIFAAHTSPLPSIRVGGLRIYEPMTAITDFLLTLLAFYFARRLWRQSGATASRTRRAWAGGFIGSGLAALAGGLFHGFGPGLPTWARLILWKLTMISTGLTSLCMLLGTVYATAQAQTRGFWLAVVTAKSMLYAAIISHNNDFRYVVYDYVSAMLAILAIQLPRYRSEPTARAIAHGIGISFLAAAIQQVGINLHTHFNKNDLYHVVQGVGFWLFYRGARGLEDK